MDQSSRFLYKFKNKLKILRSRVQGSRTSSRFQDQEFKVQEQAQDFKIKSSRFKNKFKLQDQDYKIQEQDQRPLNSSTSRDQVHQVFKSSSSSRSRPQDSRTSYQALGFKHKSRSNPSSSS